VGSVYPAGTKAAQFLRAYGQTFGAVELNATHYGVPEASRIAAWCAEVPEAFVFCPKVPQSISHVREPKIRELLAFAERVQCFGARLGPCFLQFPEYADHSWKRTVFELTRVFPHRLALELRHEDWFADPRSTGRVLDYLASKNIALVLTDTPGRRDVLHMARTAPFTFVRFLGNSLHPTDFSRLDDWANRLGRWSHEAAQETFFFMHQPNEVEGFALHQHMRARLGRSASLQASAVRLPA
jgi:uncharacterized protein YecE (DUF72 family)